MIKQARIYPKKNLLERLLKHCLLGSVVGAILSFLGKAVGFVAEHTWTLIVFVAGLILVWLMQKVLGKQAGKM